jgi:hypothetical protein
MLELRRGGVAGHGNEIVDRVDLPCGDDSELLDSLEGAAERLAELVEFLDFAAAELAQRRDIVGKRGGMARIEAVEAIGEGLAAQFQALLDLYQSPLVLGEQADDRTTQIIHNRRILPETRDSV